MEVFEFGDFRMNGWDYLLIAFQQRAEFITLNSKMTIWHFVLKTVVFVYGI